MTDRPALHAEIDGRPAAPDLLQRMVLDDYWHFTAMQVRGGRVRGLGLHLARLAAANRELFGAGFDADEVRGLIRGALARTAPDGSVRVYLFQPDAPRPPAVLVTVRPPGDMPPAAQTLTSVPYERPAAHLKHSGGFQAYYRRLAARDGFDEILLTSPHGVVAEGGITNIGFFDGASVVWPDAPMLAGVTLRLLEPLLPAAGVASVRRRVLVGDLAAFRAAFVTNARGIAPVARIDDAAYGVDQTLIRTLNDVYDAVPWDEI
jgi:branched-subunit amino acid aminotransferase/4-amino-4-deoxychorismate lyase